MKKILSAFVMIFVLSFSLINVQANDTGIKVMLDEQYVDVVPTIIDGRTLLPIRDIIELLGGSIKWDEETHQATVLKEDTTIILTIDSLIAYVNDDTVELDVSPQIINDRTMIPLRFVASCLGVVVDFQENTVIISTNSTSTIDEVTEFTSEQSNAYTAPSLNTSSPNTAEYTTPKTETVEEDTKETIVYITNSGKKYHLSGCRNLSKSKIPIDLSTARKNYSPCTICNTTR